MYEATRAKYNGLKTIADKVEWLAQECSYIEFINGKWFTHHKQIDKPNRFLFKIFQEQRIRIKDAKEIDEVIDTYIQWYGKNGRWYDAPIIMEAKERLKEMDALGLPLPPLPYPLNEFKLKILHSLIDGDQPYFFILTGEGGCGKSTFGNIVKMCFDGDVSSTMLDKIDHDSYLSGMLEHRLCYSAEITSGEINEAMLKKLVTKDAITCRHLFGKPYEVQPQTVYMWCCNENIPRIDVTDSGMVRRTIFYHMTKDFDTPIVGLDKKEWSRDDIIVFIMHALMTPIDDIKEAFYQMTMINLLKNNPVYKYQFEKWEDFKTAYFQIEGTTKYMPSLQKWSKIKEIIKQAGLWNPEESWTKVRHIMNGTKI